MTNDPQEEMIITKLKGLDKIHPPHLPDRELLWVSFTKRKEAARARTRTIRWSIAAAILILAVASYRLTSFGPSQTDMLGSRTPEFTVSASEQNALEYIKRICTEKNISCSSPVILELRADLAVSFDKLKEIDQQLLLYGDDAHLIRAKARIENHQSRVIKAIVQTL